VFGCITADPRGRRRTLSVLDFDGDSVDSTEATSDHETTIAVAFDDPVDTTTALTCTCAHESSTEWRAIDTIQNGHVTTTVSRMRRCAPCAHHAYIMLAPRSISIDVRNFWLVAEPGIRSALGPAYKRSWSAHSSL